MVVVKKLKKNLETIERLQVANTKGQISIPVIENSYTFNTLVDLKTQQGIKHVSSNQIKGHEWWRGSLNWTKPTTSSPMNVFTINLKLDFSVSDLRRLTASPDSTGTEIGLEERKFMTICLLRCDSWPHTPSGTYTPSATTLTLLRATSYQTLLKDKQTTRQTQRQLHRQTDRQTERKR